MYICIAICSYSLHYVIPCSSSKWNEHRSKHCSYRMLPRDIECYRKPTRDCHALGRGPACPGFVSNPQPHRSEGTNILSSVGFNHACCLTYLRTETCHDIDKYTYVSSVMPELSNDRICGYLQTRYIWFKVQYFFHNIGWDLSLIWACGVYPSFTVGIWLYAILVTRSSISILH